MARRKLFRRLFGSLAVLALCVPSIQAAPTVVQYTGNLGFGFGDNDVDGGGEDPDFANNAVPPCTLAPLNQAGSAQPTVNGGATTASVNFVGLATVDPTAAAPQAVKFLKQAKNVGLHLTGCVAVQLVFGPAFTRRTQMATLTWPKTTGTVSAGGGFGGSTGAPFTFNPAGAGALNQAVQVTAPATRVKFGGAVMMAGSGNSILGIEIGPVPGQTVYVGSLPVAFAVGGEGGPATPTLVVTSSSPFWLQTQAPVPAGCVPISQNGGTPCVTPPATPTGTSATQPPFSFFASGANFPWTTGIVRAFDNAGDFTTTRTRTGFDNRNAAGTMGTLSLVTPNVLFISSLLTSIGLATTAELTLTFVPEPAATTLLASGLLMLGGLYTQRRRKR
jgi:hypothetical protein